MLLLIITAMEGSLVITAMLFLRRLEGKPQGVVVDFNHLAHTGQCSKLLGLGKVKDVLHSGHVGNILPESQIRLKVVPASVSHST